MGQKANPVGLRLGVNRTWDSRWYAEKGYAALLQEDFKIREYIEKKLKKASISRVLIERPAGKAIINIHTARPGLIIGKKGADIESLRTNIQKMSTSKVALNIFEVRKPDIDSKLVAESVAQQLERRVAFRRAMKRTMQNAMRAGAKGIRINCAGRLAGADIARTEWYREGRVPLHMLRSDVDYGMASARTTYGIIGVKVWIFKGEIVAYKPHKTEKDDSR